MTATLASILNDLDRLEALLGSAAGPALLNLLPWLIVATAMIAAALAAWSLARRAGHDRPHHAASFRRLCRGIGLTTHQRRLLLRLAAGAGQELPATMLISRGCFESAIAAATIASRTSPDIEPLRRAIFGPDDDPGSPLSAASD